MAAAFVASDQRLLHGLSVTEASATPTFRYPSEVLDSLVSSMHSSDYFRLYRWERTNQPGPSNPKAQAESLKKKTRSA